MKLKIRLLKWSAGLPVAMLNKKTAEEIGVRTKDRISIKVGSKKVSTTVNIIEKTIKENEIAVSSELKKRLGLKIDQQVEVDLASPPRSISLIKKKLNKQSLSRGEVQEIINDIVSNNISEAEVALFVSAMYKNKMSFNETVYLIEAILKSGNKLSLKNKLVADKHSIGGVAGNRTTPLVISICAAAGLTMPKTSSRAITSAAGTADVIETIAKIEFSISDLKKIVHETGACMVWGGALGMVPADSKIIKVEKILKVDPDSQLLASIMAKKLAVDSKYILIDIPYGKSAKVNKTRAEYLKKQFERLGKHFKRRLKVVLTDGRQPIGNGVGPVLELLDVINILDPKKTGPEDLEKKSAFLAGELLEMTGKAKKNQGEKMAQEILCSGKAFEKFKEIIKAQKGQIKNLEPAKFRQKIKSKKSGTIKEIDNKKINALARVAGCPADKTAGIYLLRHVGDKIKKGDTLLTLYSKSKNRLNEAVKLYKKEKPIR